MTYDKSVAFPSNSALSPALDYAAAFDRFNRQATNFMTWLYHLSAEAAAGREDFASALNKHRDAVIAEDDFESEETKRGIYVTAAMYGVDLHDVEFQSWVNSFSYNAYVLGGAEKHCLQFLSKAPSVN